MIQHEATLYVGRNKPCPCGSGKKFKKCCLTKVKDVVNIPAEIRQQFIVDQILGEVK